MNTEITNTSLQEENWDMVIQPQRSLLDLCLGELWRYRDLVLLFVGSVIFNRVEQTFMGTV